MDISENIPILACESNLDFLLNIADHEFKLIVTSPPYNLGKQYENKLSVDEYLAVHRKVIGECVRTLHPQGSLCWQVGNFVRKG